MYIAFIVFTINGKVSAIELDKFPHILKPNEYQQNNKTDRMKYLLNKRQIKILELSDSNNQNFEEMRLLVGEFNNRLFGFFVDEVHAIVNVELENIHFEFPVPKIEYDGQLVEIIDVETHIKNCSHHSNGSGK